MMNILYWGLLVISYLGEKVKIVERTGHIVVINRGI